MHGTIDRCTCPLCGRSYELAEVRRRQLGDAEGVPRCDCSAPLKPDVVLFGENLPADALARADQLATAADLMLCIGSSLEVYPVAQLPAVTLAAGGKIAILTQGRTPFDAWASVRCGGDVIEELDALLGALGIGLLA
jgi:NAD-dependent deacetylase